MLNLKLITMKSTLKFLTLLFVCSLTFVACSDDDHHDDHDHEEEVITTVTLTLTNTTTASNIVTLKYTDLDGEGGNDGTYQITGTLMANENYTGVIQLLNEAESPADNITTEVQSEGDEHEFFYTNTAGLTITKTDNDANGNPLGINTTVVTGEAGNGSLTVILKHEPTKPNNDTAASAGGSTDVEVSYPITVQ